MSITDMIVNKFTHSSDEDTAKHGTDYDPSENMDAVYSPPMLPPLPSQPFVGQKPQQFSIAAAFTPPNFPPLSGATTILANADVIAASLVGTVEKLNASSEYGKTNNPPVGLPTADHLACFLNEYAAMKDELASLRQQVAGLLKTVAAEQFAHAQTKETLATEEANHENTKDALTTVHEAHQAEMTRHQETIGDLSAEQDAHGETKATLEDMTSENTRLRVRLSWISKLCSLGSDGYNPDQPLSPDDTAELSRIVAGLVRVNGTN